MGERLRRREELIEALATYLTKHLAGKSIILEMGTMSARYDDVKEWQKLFQAAGLSGYPTKEEAVEKLRELL
jgi:hypothetical protein